MWWLAVIGLAIAFVGKPSVEKQLRKAGCELLAAWDEGAGADLVELTVPNLAAMMLDVVDPDEEHPEYDELAAEIATELIEEGGC